MRISSDSEATQRFFLNEENDGTDQSGGSASSVRSIRAARSRQSQRWKLALGGLILTAAVGLGCAKPVPHVTNVVVDADVQGCTLGSGRLVGGLDVAIIIDTSQSTRRPSGIDVDRDGRIPPFHGNSSIERGDSRLAAQIAALRPLVEIAADHDIRFSVVTYAGASGVRLTGKSANSGTSSETQTRASLTRNTRYLKRVFDDVLARGSNGSTVFFAGMQQGSRTLVNSRVGGRRRVALLLSDASRPTGSAAGASILPGSPATKNAADPRMKNVAVLARERQIVFHTFGLSPDSGTWRHRALGQIAGATGGTYHAVEDPNSLYCHLVDSLAPNGPTAEIERAFARAREHTMATRTD
jgi:hypothetical protein